MHNHLQMHNTQNQINIIYWEYLISSSIYNNKSHFLKELGIINQMQLVMAKKLSIF